MLRENMQRTFTVVTVTLWAVYMFCPSVQSQTQLKDDTMNSGFVVKSEEAAVIKKWLAGLGDITRTQVGCVSCVSWKQGWGRLHQAQSILDAPLCLAGKQYAWGLGTHADSEIVIKCSKPLKSFRTLVGIDDNRDSVKGIAECKFSIWSGDKCLTESSIQNVKSAPGKIAAELNGATEFILKVKALNTKVKSLNTTHLAHADWVECEAITADGEVLKLGDPATRGLSDLMPVSFRFAGIDSEQWFCRWGIRHTLSQKSGFILHQFVTRDTETGLECRVELEEYEQFPAVLWNVYFTNLGKTATPILERVKILDITWPAATRKILHHAHGAFHYAEEKTSAESFRDNFMMVTEDLNRTSPVTIAGVGGRPSVDWMPYFNFEGKDEGLMFGIGWTGQWQAQIKDGSESVKFQAGMEFIHTRIEPGETIRQPAILMIYWQGEAIRGHNLLRHFLQEKILPRDRHGKTLQAPTCNLTWGGMVASSHLERISNINKEKIPFDYYWIDAGWYGNAGPNMDEFTPEWGSQAGNWKINRDTFPNGFKEISNAVHAAGKKLLLWVEPERAIQGTAITLEHPEWFLGQKEHAENMLMNLGNPEARKWCTELIAGLITNEGLDCYRQDFNFSPLPYWQNNDTPERVGISEIRYVEGLYAFLGELRRRFPDLLIDNCASGGRRLDFEMMRYSIPLWGSDMQCFPGYITERNQQQIQGLSYWLPQFAFGTQNNPGDTYHFRSTMAAGVIIHMFTYEKWPVQADYPYPWLRERLNEYHRARVYFSGDFYPFCDQTASFKYWTANQYNRPDLDGGILEVFRKAESDYEKMRFHLQGLDANSNYEVEDADSGKKVILSGRELTEVGLSVEIPQRRDSRLFFYYRK